MSGLSNVMVNSAGIDPGWDFNGERGNQVPAKSLTSQKMFGGTHMFCQIFF